MSEQELPAKGAGERDDHRESEAQAAEHAPMRPSPGGDDKADGTKTTPESATSSDVGAKRVNPALATAIHLGWRMAELYSESAQVVPPASGEVVPPASGGGTLPGISGLKQRQIILLRLREVAADVSSLGAGPVPTADLESVTKIVGSQLPGWAPPEPGETEPPVTADVLAQFHDAVYSVHCELLSVLSAADRQLGIAYGMGRATADLYLRPAPTQDKALADLDGRIPRIQQWLLNLKSSLPPHTAEGVSQSMTVWLTWVRGANADEWKKPARWPDPLHPSTTSSAVSWDLCEQAARWRQVLTGETVATDLLSADDLAQAGNGLLQRIYKLGTQLWARYWPIVVPTIVVLAAMVVGVSFAAGGTGAIATTLVALAGVFGITWKGTQATLGSVLKRAEEPLWDAELDLAVAKAITVLPGGVHVDVDVPRSGLAQALIPWRTVPSPTLTDPIAAAPKRNASAHQQGDGGERGPVQMEGRKQA